MFYLIGIVRERIKYISTDVCGNPRACFSLDF